MIFGLHWHFAVIADVNGFGSHDNLKQLLKNVSLLIIKFTHTKKEQANYLKGFSLALSDLL